MKDDKYMSLIIGTVKAIFFSIVLAMSSLNLSKVEVEIYWNGMYLSPSCSFALEIEAKNSVVEL